MHPVHDADALLLLAVGLASKRRPAEPLEIVAAIDLIQSAIPAEAKLAEAFARLLRHGLLLPRDSGWVLTPPAEAMIAELPKKADSAERLFGIKNRLADWNDTADDIAGVDTTTLIDTLAAAIKAHGTAAAGTGKNLLMPKPKPAAPQQQRPGQRQRRPPPPRRRKD